MQNKSSQANQPQTDEDLKNAGNRFFSSKKFEEAIQCYSKAIVSILFIVISNFDQVVSRNNHTLQINISFMTPAKNFSVLQSMTSLKPLSDAANNDLHT